MKSNNLKRDRQRVCVVCEDDSDGLHFGQPTCRACAAFFRRSVSQKLQYTCKRNGVCEIDKGARNACRACRLQKCLGQGMLPSAVQNQSAEDAERYYGGNVANNNNSNNNNSNVLPPLTSPLLGTSNISGGQQSAFQQLTTTNFPMSSSSSAPNFNAPSNGPQYQYHQQMSSNSSEFSPITPAPIKTTTTTKALCTSTTSTGECGQQSQQQYKHLGRMLDGYHQLRSLVKASQAMVKHDNDDLVIVRLSGGGEMFQSHFDSFKKLCKISMSLTFDIVDRFFWPFNELALDDKRKVFKGFMQLFCNANRAFLTSKQFGPGDDRLIMPDGGYVQLSQLHLFFKDSKRVTGDPEQVARIFHNAIQFLITNVVGHMRNIDMQEMELVAMVGMFLWTDSAELSSATLQLVQHVRNEIIVDLHHYYRSLGLSPEETTLKTANLFLLIPKLETVVKMMIEDASISDLFNMLTVEECCKGHVLV